jgi:hypothetical protein
MIIPIYTYGDGTPIEGRPEHPGEYAPREDLLAYMRAKAAYLDRVADVANQSFSKAFARRLREKG